MYSWWFFILFLLVPILVHLFDFRRAKKFYFSSIQFISRQATKTKSKSKLKYYLLLSNRIALFIGLIFLIWDESQTIDILEDDLSIYYDNSISSTLGRNDVNLSRVLEELKNTSLVSIYTNDDHFRMETGDFEKGIPVSYARSKLDEFIGGENTIYSELFILSDFQDVLISFLNPLASDSFNTYWLILSNDLNKIRNVMIDSLFLRHNPYVLSELNVHVSFSTYNVSSGSIVIKLMRDSEQLGSIVRDVSELDYVTFSIPKSIFGEFKIVVEGDEVNYDNAFYFSISAQEKPTICLLEGSNGQFIYDVYGNDELFDVFGFLPGNINYESLLGSDLIAMTGLASIPNGFRDQLASDKAFVLFPDELADILSYGEFLDLEFSEHLDSLSEIDIDYQHPLFRGIFDGRISGDINLKIRPAFEVKGDYETIIKFRDGTPFLIRKDEVYFFNTFGESATVFQSSALFLPIMYQIAFFTTNEVRVPYYYPGDKVVVSSRSSDVPVRIVNANNEFIPSYNSVEKELVLQLDDDVAPGFYLIVQSEDTLRHIAVNLRKEESIMKAPTLEELNEMFSGLPNVNVIDGMDRTLDEHLLTNHTDSTVWKYALILVMFFVITETLLHRYLR